MSCSPVNKLAIMGKDKGCTKKKMTGKVKEEGPIAKRAWKN